MRLAEHTIKIPFKFFEYDLLIKALRVNYSKSLGNMLYYSIYITQNSMLETYSRAVFVTLYSEQLPFCLALDAEPSMMLRLIMQRRQQWPWMPGRPSSENQGLVQSTNLAGAETRLALLSMFWRDVCLSNR